MIKILITSLFIIIFFNNCVTCEKPNCCDNFLSYLDLNPRHCWYNPDINRSIPDIIVSHGYPLEYYDVTTKDNYIMTIFRMPKQNRKGIVYFQHPFVTNSVIWVDKGNSSLAFILYDAGYEIWIGHLRESIFGKRHKYLNISSKEFYNFSFHETGIYDIPAQVDLIVNVSQAKPQEITYIGLSMSGTAGLVYSTMFPENTKKYLNLFVLMAPPGFIRHIWPVFFGIAKATKDLKKIFDWVGMVEFTVFKDVINVFDLCQNAPFMYICTVVELVFFGNTWDDLKPEWAGVKYAHKPDAVVVKTIAHFGQMTDSRQFQMFDYGKEKNLEVYGTEKPLPYPLQDIQTPIYLIYSDTDVLIAKNDIEDLYNALPERAKIYGKLFIKNLSHISFSYGRQVKELVYLPILNLINEVTKKRNENAHTNLE